MNNKNSIVKFEQNCDRVPIKIQKKIPNKYFLKTDVFFLCWNKKKYLPIP